MEVTPEVRAMGLKLQELGYKMGWRDDQLYVDTVDKTGHPARLKASDIMDNLGDYIPFLPKKDDGMNIRSKLANDARFAKQQAKLDRDDDRDTQLRKAAADKPGFGLRDIPLLQTADDVIRGVQEIAGMKPKDTYGPMVKGSQYGSFMTHAGRETDKLLTGAADIGDIIQGMAGEDININMARRNKRKAEQQSADEMYKYLDEESNLSKIGSMLPYTITGISEPLATKAVGGTMDALSGAAKAGARKVGEKVVQGGKYGSGKIQQGYERVQEFIPQKIDDLVHKGAESFGKMYQRDVGTPLKLRMDHFKSRDPVPDPFAKDTWRSLGGSALIGAGEGVARYGDEESITDSTISSTIGNLSGQILKNVLSRAPNMNSPSENQIIRKYHSKGRRTKPGEWTGIPQWQNKEASMKGDPNFSAAIKNIDDHNNNILLKDVAEASGFKEQEVKNLTQAKLKTHVDDLKEQYEILEAQTKGDPSRIDDFDELVAQLDDFEPHIQNRIMAHITKLEEGFEGKDYKNIRKKLKKASDAAYKTDAQEKQVYDDLLAILDKNLDKNMEIDIGPKMTQQYRDLSEKYAMTSLLMEHGLGANHKVDIKRLGSYLGNNDARRLLTGQGGRIQTFHDIARMSEVESSQSGKILGNQQVDHDPRAPASGTYDLLATPQAATMGPFRKTKFNAYMSGWPSVTGVLNLPRKGMFTSENMMRAMEQGTDVHRKTLEPIVDTGISTWNWLSDAIDKFTEDNRDGKDKKDKLEQLIR